MTSASHQREQFQNILGSRFAPERDEDDELKNHINQRLEKNHFISRPRFSYKPLDRQSHIRLAVLIPGEIGDEICCMLLEINPSAGDDKYIALSYVCGDSTETLPVVCNGCQSQIPVNLYSCLLRLRHREHQKPIWIDALCINQASSKHALKERANQIRLMGQIYSKARFVVADLGGANAERSKSLSWIVKQLGAGGICNPFTLAKSANVHIERIKNGSRAWALYAELMKRPWFRCVWVAQEFVLAKRVIMMYGTLQIEPSNLLATSQQMSSTIQGPAENQITSWTQVEVLLMRMRDKTWTGPVLATFTWLVQLRYARSESNWKPPLVTALNFCRSRLTTNARDYVYAIMSLVEDSELANFKIDYNENTSGLILRLAQRLVQLGQGEYCLAKAYGVEKEPLEHPSWAPPLYRRTLFDSQGLVELNNPNMHFPPIYKAGGTTKSSLRLEECGKVMVVHGSVIDKVEHFTEPMMGINNDDIELPSPIDGNIYHIIDWYKEASRWAQHHFHKWTENKLQQSLTRTVLLDATGHDHTHDKPCRLAANGQPLRAVGNFYGSIQNKCHKRRLCRTGRGRMALIPQYSQEDDEIWIFSGISVPFVLRRSGNFHELVGPCYVQDMMDGQALKLPGFKFDTVRLK